MESQDKSTQSQVMLCDETGKLFMMDGDGAET